MSVEIIDPNSKKIDPSLKEFIELLRQRKLLDTPFKIEEFVGFGFTASQAEVLSFMLNFMMGMANQATKGMMLMMAQENKDKPKQ
jgi:hypothetical protein